MASKTVFVLLQAALEEERILAKQRGNIAAIYCRLSRDDGGDSESNSISSQRMMLSRYANEQGFQVYSEYIDDWRR